jgi:hypothetical protein
MGNLTQKDIDVVMQNEDMKACCDRVKQSMKHTTEREKKSFKFGVSAALGGVDEIVDQLASEYGQFRFEDDDVKLITRNIEKKLQEVE